MRLQGWMLAALVLSLLAGCDNKSLSGLYLTNGGDEASGRQFVEALHLVQANTGEIAGNLESVVLDKDGKMQSNSANLSGIVDGSHLSLTIKNGPFKSFWSQRTGEVSGNTITITWMDSGRLNHATFTKSSDADFSDLLKALRSSANRLANIKRHNDEVADELHRLSDLAQKTQRLIQTSSEWRNTELIARRRQALHHVTTLLEEAKQLLATGNNFDRGRAQFNAGQIEFAEGSMLRSQGDYAREIDSADERLRIIESDLSISACKKQADPAYAGICSHLAQLEAEFNVAKEKGRKILAAARQIELNSSAEMAQIRAAAVAATNK